MAGLLACLGASRIPSNMNQLARAANSGSFWAQMGQSGRLPRAPIAYILGPQRTMPAMSGARAGTLAAAFADSALAILRAAVGVADNQRPEVL